MAPAPVSYIPQVVDQIGDWLVCEDALGLFYHHVPTQQSYDNAPNEFLMLFPGGYVPPPLGAFAAAPPVYMPNVVQAAPVTYAQPIQQTVMVAAPMTYASAPV